MRNGFGGSRDSSDRVWSVGLARNDLDFLTDKCFGELANVDSGDIHTDFADNRTIDLTNSDLTYV